MATRVRQAALAPSLVIFVLAVAIRVGSVLWRGGYGGYFNYDSGVYYAAAAALVHGRMPYSDFTLVHPPGNVLLLTPSAWIGGLTTDKTGYLLANLTGTVLGALAAVLAALVVRQVVPSRLAMWTAGIGYAIYAGAVYAEREARLEPIGNALLLAGLLCLLRARRARWWVTALGGAALAAAVSVKIWYVVPAAIVLLGYLVGRGPWLPRWRRLRSALGGAVVAAVLIDGPFFVAAPHAMYRAVIVDQLTRRSKIIGPFDRLVDASGLKMLTFPPPNSHHVELAAASLVVAALILVIVLAALRPGGRIPAAMLVAQSIVLYRSPSFFLFYVDYLTPTAAVCAGIAVGVVAKTVRARLARRARRPVRVVGGLVLAGVAVWSLVLAVVNSGVVSGTYPSTQFTRAVAGSRCVLSNTPQALIQLDALSRGLADGCPNWVDFNGRLLGVDRYRRGPGIGPRDAKWHRDYNHYILSGDAVALIAADKTNMSKRLMRILGTAPVLARADGFVLLRVTDRQRQQLRRETGRSRPAN